VDGGGGKLYRRLPLNEWSIAFGAGRFGVSLDFNHTWTYEVKASRKGRRREREYDLIVQSPMEPAKHRATFVQEILLSALPLLPRIIAPHPCLPEQMYNTACCIIRRAQLDCNQLLVLHIHCPHHSAWADIHGDDFPIEPNKCFLWCDIFCHAVFFYNRSFLF
jgi:hypothetical protein